MRNYILQHPHVALSLLVSVAVLALLLSLIPDHHSPQFKQK